MASIPTSASTTPASASSATPSSATSDFNHNQVGLIGFVKKEPPQEKVDVDAIRARFVKKSPLSSSTSISGSSPPTLSIEESKDALRTPELLSPRRLEMNPPGSKPTLRLRPSSREPLNFGSISPSNTESNTESLS